VDLYSTSSRTAFNALPLPVRQRWSPQANPFSQASANTAKPQIRADVSRDMPVYSPSFRQVLIPAYPQRAGSGWVGLGDWSCAEVVYPSKDGHPPRHWPGLAQTNYIDQVQRVTTTLNRQPRRFIMASNVTRFLNHGGTSCQFILSIKRVTENITTCHSAELFVDGLSNET